MKAIKECATELQAHLVLTKFNASMDRAMIDPVRLKQVYLMLLIYIWRHDAVIIIDVHCIA